MDELKDCKMLVSLFDRVILLIYSWCSFEGLCVFEIYTDLSQGTLAGGCTHFDYFTRLYTRSLPVLFSLPICFGFPQGLDAAIIDRTLAGYRFHRTIRQLDTQTE